MVPTTTHSVLVTSIFLETNHQQCITVKYFDKNYKNKLRGNTDDVRVLTLLNSNQEIRLMFVSFTCKRELTILHLSFELHPSN